MGLEKLISYFGIASGDTKLFPRGIQFIAPETGWQGFVDKYIVPQRKLGISRFLLWMPFGIDELRTLVVNGKQHPTVLRFDQYQQALATAKWATEGFVEAIRPLTLDGCQVIAYTGMLGGAPEIERRRWDRQAWIDECLAPFKAANCDLAVDSACLSTNDYVTRLARDIRFNSAAKFYCEAMPLTDAPEWAGGDVISTEEQYQVALLPSNRDLLVNPKRISGEVIRMFTTSGVSSAVSKPWYDAAAAKMNWAGWYRTKVPAALADSPTHSVCLHLRLFLEQNGKLDELHLGS
jgi:hypothetical protein